MFDMKKLAKPRLRCYPGDKIVVKDGQFAVEEKTVTKLEPRGLDAPHPGERETCGHCTDGQTPWGLCFQCQGKGWQSNRDRFLNARYQRRVA